jgi:lambda family phage portal protein
MTFKPSLFDRALLALAPQAGLARVKARMQAAELFRAYDGAAKDRRLSGWRASSSGPRAEGDTGRETLRYRARDLAQNNATAAAAKLQFAAQTVGSGITPRAVGGSKAMRKRAQDAWKRFVDTCDADGNQDYYGLLSLTAQSLFTDGEVLHVWRQSGGERWRKLRVLEADHLDETRVELVRGRNDRVVNGIEFDADGARKAYWLNKVHPGETDVLRLLSEAERIDAQHVDHYFHVARPGQIRGVSWLAPSIVSLRGLDDVAEAVLWRKRLEACIGIIIRTPEAAGSLPTVGKQSAGDSGERLETMRPGMMPRLGPGEDLTAFQPTVSADTIDFIRWRLYAFCATTGLAYHEITGDASQANYSSMRAAKLAGWALLDLVQWVVFAPRIKTAWRRVMEAEYNATGNDVRSIGCELSMPVRPWVDPLKDIMAKVLEIRAGLLSHPDALAERGVNMDEFITETVAFLKEIDAAGLIFDTDPRKTNDSGALQAAVKAQGASAGGQDAQPTN